MRFANIHIKIITPKAREGDFIVACIYHTLSHMNKKLTQHKIRFFILNLKFICWERDSCNGCNTCEAKNNLADVMLAIFIGFPCIDQNDIFRFEIHTDISCINKMLLVLPSVAFSKCFSFTLSVSLSQLSDIFWFFILSVLLPKKITSSTLILNATDVALARYKKKKKS